VAYKSKPGPWGFKPQEVSQTLERLFPKMRASVTRPTQTAVDSTSALQ
jgi:hypothetical protein